MSAACDHNHSNKISIGVQREAKKQNVKETMKFSNVQLKLSKNVGIKSKHGISCIGEISTANRNRID